MAKVKCEICGENMMTTGKNYLFVNGINQHKKCPSKSKLTPEEAKALKDLTDSIKWVSEKQKVYLSPTQWVVVASQIKKLVEQGYDHAKQLKAFQYYFDPLKNTEYKGYGIMSYVIEQCLKDMEEMEELKSRVKSDDSANMAEVMERKRKERLEMTK